MQELKTNIEDIDHSDTVSATRTVARYLHHLRSITIIRQIIPLMIASQQHRGANLALQEGDKYFERKVVDLQYEITNRFNTMQLLNRELSTPVSVQNIESLYQEWQTLKDWSGGSSLENYNLHSHFIEQQMKVIWSVAARAGSFSLAKGRADQQETARVLSAGMQADDGLLVRFILHEIPELIELIARIRGLATHASAVGVCDDEHSSWLEYLLKQLNQKKERFRILSKSLQTYVREMPSVIELQIQDVRIVQLIQFVERNIIRKVKITPGNHDVFTMATNIINVHTGAVKQGLDFIQNKIHEHLDNSHYEPDYAI